MHHAIKTKATLTLLLAASGQIFGQGTLQIKFEGPPTLPPGSGVLVQDYSEAGMSFEGITGTFGFVRRWSGDPRDPDNGTPAFLQAGFGSSLRFGWNNGAAFDLVSVDLAEYATTFAQPTTVHFVGFRPDGSIVTTDLTTDGIIDGTGPLKDFETFFFQGFTGLSRVEIPTYGWSLDNLVVSIPEPGTWVLLLVGGLLIVGLRRRRKSSLRAS